MQDTIIKGTGNSRKLKTVANALTLYPTYESFIAALVAGTFPVDFNGINTAGVQQTGTQLNKSTLLTDALCSALGLATTATPTQAMDKLRQLINTTNGKIPKLEMVYYAGTGTYGASNPCSITFSFSPKAVFCLGGKNISYGVTLNSAYKDDGNPIIVCEYEPTSYSRGGGFFAYQSTNSYVKISTDRKTLTWYHDSSANAQLNNTFRYYFLGIG